MNSQKKSKLSYSLVFFSMLFFGALFYIAYCVYNTSINKVNKTDSSIISIKKKPIDSIKLLSDSISKKNLDINGLKLDLNKENTDINKLKKYSDSVNNKLSYYQNKYWELRNSSKK